MLEVDLLIDLFRINMHQGKPPPTSTQFVSLSETTTSVNLLGIRTCELSLICTR